MVKYWMFLVISYFIPLLAFSQTHSQANENWTVTELLPLPEPITNQSVVAAKVKGKTKIYSFYGLDKTKKWSGIHQKAFCLDLKKNKWKQVKNVPDSLGRLASAGNRMKDKIYIVGGYAVFENHTEESSSALHIFDPKTLKYTQGKNLIYPIDDHVQSTYKDSLLYIVTGWSESLNINKTQVYFPEKDTWKEATPVPNDSTAKVFGASGMILGDTLYYLGGASYGKNYPLVDTFYKGYIDPQNPLQIAWQKAEKYPAPLRYRAGVFSCENKIYWLGGSAISYNYNAISYKEKKPVQPNSNILEYSPKTRKFQVITLQKSLPIMDIRNIAPISDNSFVIMGGINQNQEVSDKVFLIEKK